jgi:hypothetical protein
MSVRKSDDDKYEARLIRATWDEMCRDDLQYFATSNNLDCLTARLLLEFQDAFLVGIEIPLRRRNLNHTQLRSEKWDEYSRIFA